jgi:DNA polymerase-3 subunit delta
VALSKDLAAMLVEAVAGDASRIAIEIEKLSLLTAGERPVTGDDIATLTPDARAASIFGLVAALGRSDRRQALETLDTLVREGEYLPLALSFLATQFRLALVAKEANLRNASQIEAHFRKLGTPMWRARAEQVAETVQAFPKDRLERAIRSIYRADKGLRDTRPDDRVVMEQFVLDLTER